MITILRFFYLLLFLFIGAFVAGFFLPSEVKVSASVEVEARPEIIFPQINELRNWEEWSPWHKNNSTIQTFINGKNGQGASMHVENSLAGNFDVLITHNQPYESIAANFDFGTGSKTSSVWFVEHVKPGTLVNWTFTTKNLTFWERYFAYFSREKIKTVLNSGLDNLKQNCEELKHSRVGNIELMKREPVPAVIMVDSVTENNINKRITEMDAYLLRFFERREMRPAGDAFIIRYGQVSDSLFKIACGYPMQERTWVWRTLQYFPLEGGKIVTASHYGSKSTGKAHAAILDYIDENNLTLNGQHWEVELFNKVDNPDSTLWETKVYYPVK